MLRKILLLLIFSIPVFAHAQQLTRICVVDLPKVYQATFRESRAVREFEERSGRVQTEVDRRQKEILELRSRHSEVVLNDNQSEANRLEAQIHRLTTALSDYFQTQTAILDDQRQRLMQSGSFLNQVMDEIRYIAESEGYSVVLDKSNRNTGIVWHSQTVDITDKLIANLQAKSGR